MAKATQPAAASKTATAPKTAPTSAAPGTVDKKAGKKDKIKKVKHPSLFDAEGAPIKLTAVPEDHDPRLHLPLKKNDFENEWTFLEMKALAAEQTAAKLRKEAETIKSLGSSADRARAKKLLAMQERMSELMESLRAQGLDPDAILAANK